jgi:hypothetical protein
MGIWNSCIVVENFNELNSKFKNFNDLFKGTMIGNFWGLWEEYEQMTNMTWYNNLYKKVKYITYLIKDEFVSIILILWN